MIMKTFKEVKKNQYVYRVKLADYSIQKIQVYINQNADIICGNQMYLRLKSERNMSYFTKDSFGYATCKQALRKLLQKQTDKALQALRSLNYSFVYKE